MSVLNLSEDMVECPLCMEPLEMDDLNFFPCTCGYQICRFCWHRIRTDENGLCPACRKAYPENPADFKPLSPEELARIKQEKRQKDAQRKQKVTENRKHLANVRVVQKNLVFVVGLSTRLADAETLRKPDYFGKFGKIHKVVINHTTSYAGSQLSHVQGPSASAYVTYQRAEDALRAIQAVNNIHVDGRTLKASLGTTKYCSHFMKNQQCPKPDCMYLHELGDESASFTKEEMQQGKHQEFEKKLQDLYCGTGSIPTEKNGCSNPVCSSNSSSSSSSNSSSTTNSISNGTSALTVCASLHKRSMSAGGKENSAPKSLATGLGGEVGSSSGSGVREAWPSLSAPPPTKENKKVKASKSDRNHSSSRHSPTDEHNNNKRETRSSTKERERLGQSMSGSTNSVNSTNGSTSSNTNGSSILSSNISEHSRDQDIETCVTEKVTFTNDPWMAEFPSNTSEHSRDQDVETCVTEKVTFTNDPWMAEFPSSVGDSGDRLQGLSPVDHNSPLSSSQDSCNSSASTTPPPPSCSDLLLHTPPSPPPSDHTSPISVTTGIDIQNPHSHHHLHHHHHHHHHGPSSPLTTPPSSLSSSSEPSSSLPMPQVFPSHHSATGALSHPTPAASAASSLFSDNSNSFFSSGPSLPLQRHSSPPKSPTPLAPTQQQQLHQGLTNSHQPSEDINSTTDWGSKSSEIFSMDSLLSQNRSNSTWNCIFDKNEEIHGMSNLVDDELGFDPFEETNKALAEDIKIEQKQQEQQRTQHFHQQVFQQQNHHLQQQQHHQQQVHHIQQQHQGPITRSHLRSGLKDLMNGFNNPPSGVASRTSLPPPGFNGLSSFNNFPSGSTSAGSSIGNGHQEGNKLPGLPHQYLGGLNSNPPGLANVAAQGNTLHRNNTLNGLNGLSVPPGLGASLLGGSNTLPPGGLGGNPPPHLLTPASLLAMDTALRGAGPPPGLGLPPKADAFLLKDLESGLRDIFPAISSVSTMNTLNTVNTINSMVGQTHNNQQSQQNPLASFLNMAQQQQHHHHQQHHHQHPTQHQQSLLQQLTMNSLANAHKGWNSSGGAPDLTALDPAIVSSGQLTDSRSDSPPHWMKTMEHLTNDVQPTPPPQLWNNLLPYNLPTAPPPTMAPHTGGNISVGGRGNSGNMWPPTSPPPGFNSISPLHLPKHQQTHKIENL